MTPLFKKLNLKDEPAIIVLNAPDSFSSELDALEGIIIHLSLDDADEVDFAIAFVIKQDELNDVSAALTAKARGDVKLWMAYPKKSSKTYTCEFDRDHGWDVLGAAGYEGVRMVAIDQDWSALRFRHVDYIKSLKRNPNRALSKKGRDRAKGKS